MAATSMRGSVRDRQYKRVEAGSIADCSFRNGALLAAGTVFLTQGVLWASRSMSTYAREGSLPWVGYLLQLCLLPNVRTH
jgi:hypothetical protein